MDRRMDQEKVLYTHTQWMLKRKETKSFVTTHIVIYETSLR